MHEEMKEAMDYIEFDSTRLPNLEFSLFKEILQTNRAGAYTSTTITGCNTRKYHGLLVCPLKQFGGESYVLLSSLQPSIMLEEKPFNLGVQEYMGGYFEPKGHKYLARYKACPTSTMTYRVGGVVIDQQYTLSEKEEQVMIKYTVREASETFRMRLKPFLAFRSVHALTMENMAVNTKYEEISGGAGFCLYEGFPTLYIQGSKALEFVGMPDWYKGVEYEMERKRGYDHVEDLYVPGYFEVKLKKGDNLVVSVSTSEVSTKGLATRFTSEVSRRQSKDSMKNMLINAAQQFIEYEEDGGVMLKAGYHWKKPQLRDMFLSLPSLAVFQKDTKAYSEILRTAIPNLRRLYIDEATTNNTSIDIPLWFFYTINELSKYFGKSFKAADYLDIMNDIVEFYWSGIPGKMYVDESGLIYAKQEGHPQTWMNSTTTYGLAVTPRYGKAVEVNALWYNAIATLVETAKSARKKTIVETWTPRLEKVGESFLSCFVNQYGYLYDYVDGDYRSLSVRPNMLIAAGLAHTPLSKEQKKSILDLVSRELLTPRGIRSLSPNDPKYIGGVEGIPDERALALHQGTAYPWLLGFYADVMVDVHKNSGIGRLKRVIEEIEPELHDGCVGTIAERYNGNPPYAGNGAVSMAWNVAAILKLIKIVENFESK